MHPVPKSPALRRRAALFLLLLPACGGGDDPGEQTTPKADADGWANHAFTSGTLDGCSTEIAYQTWTWDGGGPAEATVVITTGRAEYTDKYHHVVEALQDRPWNVIAWDQYGQGRSGGVRAHAEDFEAQHVCDLDTLIAELADPALPLGHVSHSTGGLIVARWQQLHPGASAASVMSAPLLGLVVEGYTVAGACAQAQLFVDSGGSESSTDPNWSGSREPCDENDVTHDCEMYEQWASDPLTLIGPATWGWLHAACQLIPVVHDDVGLLTEPLHVLQAGDDTVVDQEAQVTFCDAVGAPASCSLTVWDGAFHELFTEVERDAIIAETAAFLEQHL